MKIGEISKLCNLSQDTIRYYIKIGLLSPDFNKGYFYFKEKDIRDIEEIRRLKKMLFNIKEIKNIFKLKYLSNWVEPKILGEYLQILESKKEEIISQSIALEISSKMVNEEIKDYSTINSLSNKKLGVPIDALKYLACPYCKTSLIISNAKIENNNIYNGNLSCNCGYKASIEDGILLTNNRYLNSYDSPDLDRELYKNLGDFFLKEFQKCSSFILNKFQNMDVKNKVVLEANINGYFFLYNHFKELKNDCLYIVVDKFPEMLTMYKRLIEYLNLDLNILFIADATDSYPLANNCVDILISFFGETEYQLYHKNPYIEDCNNFLKDSSIVLGALISVDKNSKTKQLLCRKYPEGNKENIYSLSNTILSYRKFFYRVDYSSNSVKVEPTMKFASSCYNSSELISVNLYTAMNKK